VGHRYHKDGQQYGAVPNIFFEISDPQWSCELPYSSFAKFEVCHIFLKNKKIFAALGYRRDKKVTR
jgi:hypothetical protein